MLSRFSEKNGEKALSVSLLEMLTLCAVSGKPLHVTVHGRNENKTLTMIKEVFENGAVI
jgi:phosphotransferase system HPr-like phosphotransfer protein